MRALRTLLAVVLLGTLLAAAAAVPPAAATPAGVRCGAPPVGNARFVRFLYLELLGRCPDAGGLAHWTAKLDGGASRWAVADEIDGSTENLGRNNVDPLYESLLGRPPSAGERAEGIEWLRARRENATLTARLLASDEAYRRIAPTGTPAERDRAWVTAAYNRIVDREPDPRGLAFYLGYFADSGSTAARRRLVAMGLEHSRSNVRSWVLATMTEALGRTPDRAGVDHWSAWLVGPGRWQTFRLWTAQLASDEAYRRAQTLPD